MSITTTLKIGTRAEAEALFTYPNDGHETESLEDTIAHYLSDSLGSVWQIAPLVR